MVYSAETQDPQERSTSTARGVPPGGLTPEDKTIMPDVLRAMGPGQAAKDSVRPLGLEQQTDPKRQGIAQPKDIGSMWDAAQASDDFKAVNAEMAKAVSAAYASGGIDAVNNLKKQINDNVKAEKAGPTFIQTDKGIEIHNVKQVQLPKDVEKIVEKNPEFAKQMDLRKIEGLGWVKEITPIQTVKVDDKSQTKPEAGSEPGSKPDSKPESKMDKQIFAAAEIIAKKIADGKITDDEFLDINRISDESFKKFGEDAIRDKLVPEIKKQLERLSPDIELQINPKNGFSTDIFNKKTQKFLYGLYFFNPKHIVPL
jgi:hypothetical protein